MNFEEILWEKQLNIDTKGRDESKADEHHQPYQPTYYEVLDIIVKSGYISGDSVVVDYGCGKGRVGIFMSYQTKCNSIGIEYNHRIYNRAVKNKENAFANRVEFVCTDAKEYDLPDEVDSVFFFNPFSVELLASVIKKIEDSFYNCPRDIRLFFYYPSDEYIAYLMQEPMLSFVDEIDCMDLFDKHDERERIMIFEME